MSHYYASLLPGDQIFHPKCGFGTISGLKRQDRIRLVQELSSGEANAELTEEYYDIRLVQGGTLLVPVARAESVGLRRLSYGMAAVKAELHTPAESLPADFRERAAALRTRDQAVGPAALVHSVRDLVAHGRKCALSAGEKSWLEKSCQRLSTEVALVDAIPIMEAQDAIFSVVRELSLQ
jgi:RNA polymerase-interacting CarD/CdnL/TRCF family regulator